MFEHIMGGTTEMELSSGGVPVIMMTGKTILLLSRDWSFC
jgi:hypothetical protein